ncbi:HNH endonuclease [Flavobacterium sp. C3NV]|uniref:HNH endonuclease n=1 Tax=Flavobacterium sp. C3NV TaxID=3393358 RepID=UPI00398FD010
MPKKENTTSYWALKSVSDEDVTYESTDRYKDEIETKYVYDDSVANHKQIKLGDIAVIIDKKEVLGLARISKILKFNGTKKRRRCPICRSTNYGPRKTKTPKYLCNKGHEFSVPDSEIIDVTNFEACYSTSFIVPKEIVTIDKIKPFYHRKYNRNMSMQNISKDFFIEFYEAEIKKLKEEFIYPSAEESENYLSDLFDEGYIPLNKDERPKIIKTIFERRGQQKFRDSLRNLHGDKCMVTGCEILHIIEAAHINPYRGEKDNHVANGLLLRSDIHTLFDLNLIGIDPETLEVKLSESLLSSEYEEFKSRNLLIAKNNVPSINALNIRWKLFNK